MIDYLITKNQNNIVMIPYMNTTTHGFVIRKILLSCKISTYNLDVQNEGYYILWSSCGQPHYQLMEFNCIYSVTRSNII